MSDRVGICAVAQTTYVRNRADQRFQGMALDVVQALRSQTGLGFGEGTGIDATISVSDDLYDARTISNNALTDVLGAHHGCEEKVAQDGIQALYYGLAMIRSGHADVVLVVGHCKESQGESRNQVTHLAFDPFFTRPVGLDFLAAAALQAQAYQARAGLTERHLAEIVVRARSAGARNPFTPEITAVTEDEVLASPLLADPIRQLHTHPVSDGALGLILASEERARSLTDIPVWIAGVGNCLDTFFLGDRDLAGTWALQQAAARAYQRAGVTDPATAFDLVELSDPYAHQQPMWLEGLGLAPGGRGGRFLDGGGAERLNVNRSGGVLAGNPMILGGLVRAAEAAMQLMGKAEGRQVPNARRALAHGTMGPAGQFHSVAVLERD
jgi:acetyl-CoA C-acetyltransferase